MAETLEQINSKALDKVAIAKPILDKLNDNPGLAWFHDPVISKMGDSRCYQHFVTDTLYDLTYMYSTQNSKDIPEPVKKFISGANNFLYGGSN